LAQSADGRAITSKQRLDHRAGRPAMHGGMLLSPPALAGGAGRLWLAWIADAGRSISVCDAEHPGDPPVVTFGAPAMSPPSLTAAGPGATVAWTGRRRRVWLLTVTEDPAGGSLRAGEGSQLGVALRYSRPVVCHHQGRLAIAWTGADYRISLRTVTAAGPDPPVRLEAARSYSPPALCSHQGHLILAWTGTDSHVNLMTVTAGPDTPVRLEEARSSRAPALCSHQNRLILA
jgi:hypothetical protein